MCSTVHIIFFKLLFLSFSTMKEMLETFSFLKALIYYNKVTEKFIIHYYDLVLQILYGRKLSQMVLLSSHTPDFLPNKMKPTTSFKEK